VSALDRTLQILAVASVGSVALDPSQVPVYPGVDAGVVRPGAPFAPRNHTCNKKGQTKINKLEIT
jgi:hypothetical protein